MEPPTPSCRRSARSARRYRHRGPARRPCRRRPARRARSGAPAGETALLARARGRRVDRSRCSWRPVPAWSRGARSTRPTTPGIALRRRARTGGGPVDRAGRVDRPGAAADRSADRGRHRRPPAGGPDRPARPSDELADQPDGPSTRRVYDKQQLTHPGPVQLPDVRRPRQARGADVSDGRRRHRRRPGPARPAASPVFQRRHSPRRSVTEGTLATLSRDRLRRADPDRRRSAEAPTSRSSRAACLVPDHARLAGRRPRAISRQGGRARGRRRRRRAAGPAPPPSR